VFNALEIANSVSNIRRFNYIAKVKEYCLAKLYFIYLIEGCTNLIQRKTR
jgi:hypothetical protein